MSTTAKPIKWHGGKHYLAKRIVAMMPPHTHYTEAFAGGLSVLLAKSPDGVSETVNDLYGPLRNFWQVLASEALFDEFHRRLEATPLSELVFDEADGEFDGMDRVSKAVMFFVRARMSRQGLMKDYTTPTTRTRRGMNEQVSAWLTAVDGLPDVHARLRRVEIRSEDAVQFLRRYDHAKALHYCDPPYLHETRSTTGEYACEMDEEKHAELLSMLAEAKGKFILSGYRSDLYDDWATRCGWNRVDVPIDNKASASRKKEQRVECLWMNFDADT